MVSPRIAVSSPFFVSGLLIGGWAPLVPVVKNNLQLTESDIGLVILIGGIASILVMGATSWLVERYGSDVVTRMAAFLFLPSLLFIVLAPSYFWLCIAAIWFFSTVAVMDIAMNANGVEVEKTLGRPIMSSLHGFWSLGAMLGAALGGVILAMANETFMTSLMMSVGFVIFVYTLRFLQKSQLTETTLTKEALDEPKLQGFPPLNLTIYIIGLLAFISFTAEGAIIDWSALFLRQDLQASIAFSGAGFASFSLAMTFARFSGDKVKQYLGAVRLMQFSAVITFIGLAIVSSTNSLALCMFGFFLTGLGNANIVPVAFSAAAQIPGLKPGVGITTATFCGYIGLLLAPATLGFVAEYFGFRPIYMGFALCMVLVFAVSRLVRERT